VKRLSHSRISRTERPLPHAIGTAAAAANVSVTGAGRLTQRSNIVKTTSEVSIGVGAQRPTGGTHLHRDVISRKEWRDGDQPRYSSSHSRLNQRMRDHQEKSNEPALAFGPYRLLPSQRIVLRGNTPLKLGSRAREILVALVERAGEVVDKRDLQRRVWPNSVVGDATLRVHIAALRKALRQGEAGARYVDNISGRGYRFVAPVTPVEGAPQAQRTQLATSEPTHHIPEDVRERRPLLAFVHVDTASLAGMRQLVQLQDLPEVEEIHSLTGESAMLVKVRTRDAQELDSVLERMYAIEGFTATRSYIALSTYLERGRRSAKE
jgi:DNA-binding winged helix-turn-helix (wHTH) protein